MLARLIFGEHNSELQKTRPFPAIFLVNGESRSFCLEQYVPFARTYIHTSRDTLFISIEDEQRFWLYYPSFFHMPNHPIGQLGVVAIEIEYEKANKDFDGHIHWLRGLGCPKELIICLAPSTPITSARLVEHYQNTFGTTRVTDSNNKAQLVRWPKDVDEVLVQRIKPRLIRALQEEKIMNPEFRVPEVRDKLYFAYSDPEFWV